MRRLSEARAALALPEMTADHLDIRRTAARESIAATTMQYRLTRVCGEVSFVRRLLMCAAAIFPEPDARSI
jgi:uncharacterized protein (DUF2336 family)